MRPEPWKSLLPHFTATNTKAAAATLCGGGLSGAEVWQVQTPGGRYALRSWPEDIVMPERPEWIARRLLAAGTAGCRIVPIPLPTLDDPRRTCVREHDRWWQLEPWLPGEPGAVDTVSDEQLNAAFKAVAELHAALRQGSPDECRRDRSPAVAKRCAVLKELTGDGWNEVRRALVAMGDSAERQAAEEYRNLCDRLWPQVDVLLQAVERQTFRLQPVAGDLRAEHLLFEGARAKVTGIVDFGAMTVDNAALDLARLLGDLAGEDPQRRRLGLDAYCAASLTSGALSIEETLLVETLDRSGALLSPYRWWRRLYVERRSFGDMRLVAMRRRLLMSRLRKIAETSG